MSSLTIGLTPAQVSFDAFHLEKSNTGVGFGVLPEACVCLLPACVPEHPHQHRLTLLIDEEQSINCAKMDISSLIHRTDEEQKETAEKVAQMPTIPAKCRQDEPPAGQPTSKRPKWSPEEDALIIKLRGGGMKWEDISKRIPGRSAISCRLHYQNYLERRSEWDNDKKDELARLYQRCVSPCQKNKKERDLNAGTRSGRK